MRLTPHTSTRIITGLFAIAVTGGVFTSCKTASKSAKEATRDDGKGKSKITEKQRLDAEYLFFNAAKESMLGNFDEASRLYNQSLAVNPYNSAAYYELARIAYEKNVFDQAAGYAKAATTLDKKNVWYKLLYAQALQGLGKYDEAVKIFEQLAKENPESVEYAYELADGYMKAKQPENAIKALDKIEGLMGITPEIIEEKQRIYLSLGNIDKAAAEIQKLINLNPNDTQPYLVMADMYLANRMPEKAFDVYQKVLKVDPDNGPVHYSLAEYYRSTGDKDKSYEELKKAFTSSDIDIDTKVQVLLSYYNLSEFNEGVKKQAYELGDLMVKAHPTEAKAYSLYADFLFRDKRYAEARDNFKKVLELDDSKYIIWSQLIVSESELGNYQSVYDLSTKAMELFPTQPDLYLYKGIASIKLKKYKDAIAVLTDGAGLVYNNQPLEMQFYSLLGDANNAEQHFDKSDEYYDKALAIEPQNTFVLNNYSYYLTVRKQKLDKAKDMARLANTIEPNNPTFEDTYGWAFYIARDFKGAREWIEKALNNGGDKNGTILEHYGDVMYQLGDIPKAIEYWKKAKGVGGASDLIDKKLDEKKLIE